MNVGYHTGKVTFKNRYKKYGSKNFKYYIYPSNVKINKISSTNNTISCNFKNCYIANNFYTLYISENYNFTNSKQYKFTIAKNISSYTKTISNLKSGTKYYIKLIQTVKNNIIYYNSPYTIYSTITKTKVNKLTNNFYESYNSDLYASDFNNLVRLGNIKNFSNIILYLGKSSIPELKNLKFNNKVIFGCSTIVAHDKNNKYYYGRNFDWSNCNGLVLVNKTSDSLKSISTVNLDFFNTTTGPIKNKLTDSKLAQLAYFAPMDGMNESGIFVSILMLHEGNKINQNIKNKPHITETMAVRLILNKAKTYNDAIHILKKYNIHSAYNVHFAISDKYGHSAVCEYVNNNLVITKSKVVTNHYLTSKYKNKSNISNSLNRYNTLNNISKSSINSYSDIISALNKTKNHTIWSITYNPNNNQINYYFKENFNKCYSYSIK